MGIAISDEHLSLAEAIGRFLSQNVALQANRALLATDVEQLPSFWDKVGELGWLGLHIPEQQGGSGFGLEEAVIVAEQLGRVACPGPFVPTMIASAVMARSGWQQEADIVHHLAEGKKAAAVAFDFSPGPAGSHRLSGVVSAGLAAECADILLIPVNDDLAIVDLCAAGITVEPRSNLDPARRCSRVVLDNVWADNIQGARNEFYNLARLLLAAELAGVAAATTEMAAAYACYRTQFGRVIGTFQAVKHHCANMAAEAELAKSAVWDAASAADQTGPSSADTSRQFSYCAAVAAAVAIPAALHNAQLNIQIHGGIGFTWEHDAHLYLRRAAATAALLGDREPAEQVTQLAREGVTRVRTMNLPATAEEVRVEVRRFLDEIKDLEPQRQRTRMLDAGYAVPHWPRPWGREATAVEQLVIEQEFATANVRRPQYGITGWVILTIIQHGTDEQVDRWVRQALDEKVIWCQLFSEPDAGSDAAGIRTLGRRVNGGWVINGQKVWTSDAQRSSLGLATIRTDLDANKHLGITTMAIDMQSDGVTVKPLRLVTGESHFNEVFFNDVFVPDENVVGPVNGGWTVARTTLGNESVSLGGGASGMSLSIAKLVRRFEDSPPRPSASALRIGRYVSRHEAVESLNLRRAYKAISGGGPGPEGHVTKLVLSELRLEAAEILAALAATDGVYTEGRGAAGALATLGSRMFTIAGGTSEIKRNQIAERILGLPRDPLISGSESDR